MTKQAQAYCPWEYRGNLYQLRSLHLKLVGTYFPVNGPHDTHGRVLKSTQPEDGTFLNLVRGTAS